MLHEVLLALLGHTGDVITPTKEGGFCVDPSMPFLHPSERTMIDRVCVVGAAFASVQNFVQSQRRWKSRQGITTDLALALRPAWGEGRGKGGGSASHTLSFSSPRHPSVVHRRPNQVAPVFGSGRAAARAFTSWPCARASTRRCAHTAKPLWQLSATCFRAQTSPSPTSCTPSSATRKVCLRCASSSRRWTTVSFAAGSC